MSSNPIPEVHRCEWREPDIPLRTIWEAVRVPLAWGAAATLGGDLVGRAAILPAVLVAAGVAVISSTQRPVVATLLLAPGAIWASHRYREVYPHGIPIWVRDSGFVFFSFLVAMGMVVLADRIGEVFGEFSVHGLRIPPVCRNWQRWLIYGRNNFATITKLGLALERDLRHLAPLIAPRQWFFVDEEGRRQERIRWNKAQRGRISRIRCTRVMQLMAASLRPLGAASLFIIWSPFGTILLGWSLWRFLLPAGFALVLLFLAFCSGVSLAKLGLILNLTVTRWWAITSDREKKAAGALLFSIPLAYGPRLLPEIPWFASWWGDPLAPPSNAGFDLPTALSHVGSGVPGEIYNFLTTIAFWGLLPLGGIASSVIVLNLPTLISGFIALEDESAPEPYDKKEITDFEAVARTLAESPIAGEREHLYVGFESETGKVALLDRENGEGHVYLCGPTGSRKTSNLLILILQLLNQKSRSMTGWQNAVVVFDFKGDPATFNAVRAECERLGRKFKFFAVDSDKSQQDFRASHGYNPFWILDHEWISIHSLVQKILKSLAIDHGDRYGAAHFAAEALAWLAEAFRDNPGIRTFRELHEWAQNAYTFRDAKHRQNCIHLLNSISWLAGFPQLNVSRGDGPFADEAIDFSEVIANQEVIYFWLPSINDEHTARQIGKLAIRDLIECAESVCKEGRVVVACDEFQQIVSSDLKPCFNMGRSLQGVSIHFYFSNQSMSDLRTYDCDLRPLLQRFRTKIIFGALDTETIEWLQATGGEKREILNGGGSSYAVGFSTEESMSRLCSRMSESWGERWDWHEAIVPNISKSDLLRISNDPELAILHVSQGRRYSNYQGWPMEIRCSSFACSEKEYQHLESLPWPSEAETVGIRSFRPEYPGQKAIAKGSAKVRGLESTYDVGAQAVLDGLDRLGRRFGQGVEEPGGRSE